ncbi:DUF2628 domain-containing protein [Pseudoduganella sp. UC29_106]|uniref:DUF2628 domain-containing protein n=1 Tax=Pseudoduganella sp. UC29_106 TaxID=3374553 RepID=UPI003756D171
MAELSASWQRRFTLIKQAGGPELSTIQTLSAGQTFRLWFNFLALLFGPIYYICKGMWRKAITLSALILFAIFSLAVMAPLMGMDEEALTRIGKYCGPAIFCLRANIDYYKRMVLQENGWW